jgi:hypothetical protein
VTLGESQDQTFGLQCKHEAITNQNSRIKEEIQWDNIHDGGLAPVLVNGIKIITTIN